MYKLIIYDEKGAAREFDLSPGTCHLGRSKKNDIYLNEQRVSRSHAQIQLDPDGRISVEDLDSKEGTSVNGESINKKTDLKDGDEIAISSFTIEVKKWMEEMGTVAMSFSEAEGETPISEPETDMGPDGTISIDPDDPDDAELPRYHKLLIISDKRFGEEYLLDKPALTIGSSASGCDIFIDEKNIADEHARVVLSGGESVLEILDVTKETLLNGKRAKENTPLKKGDSIEIGSILFRFIDKDEVIQKDKLKPRPTPEDPGLNKSKTIKDELKPRLMSKNPGLNKNKIILVALVIVGVILVLFLLSKPRKGPSEPGGSAPEKIKVLPEKDLSIKQKPEQKPGGDNAYYNEGLAETETTQTEIDNNKTSAAAEAESSIHKNKPIVKPISDKKKGNRLIKRAIEDYLKGNNDNALKKLNAVLKLDLKNKNLLRQKASNLLGDLKNVLDFFHKGYNEYNNNQIEKAFATWSQGLILEKRIIGDKISSDSKPIRDIMAGREAREARKAFESGDFPAAYKFCEKALAIHPKHEDSLKIYNLLYSRAKKIYKEGYIIKNLDTEQSLLKMKEVLSITSPDSEYYKKANSIITGITGIKH